MLLGLLPLVDTSLLAVILATRKTRWGWKRCFIRAVVLSGSYVVITTEALSCFKELNRPALVGVWAVPLVLEISWLLYQARSMPSIQWPKLSPRLNGFSLLGWGALGVVLLITGISAWTWMPNTWDSLNYHLPRVAHWTQEHAVVHFATGIEVQNGIGPFAEYIILHTYILSLSDRWANFVEWFAMAASIIGVMLLVESFGGKRTAQFLSAALLVSLPMGIAQATSTMTDYVVALFLLAVAIESVSLYLGNKDLWTIIILGLAAGMAIGTKPTAYAYLLPFSVFTLIGLIRQASLRKIGVYSLIVVALIILLNAGQMLRNMDTYGNPIGTTKLANVHTNELMTPRGWISNIVRHASLHAGTPWESVNRVILRGIIKIHLLIDLSVDDPRTTSIGPYMFWKPRTEESFAGNSAHAYLYVFVLFFVALFYRKFPRALIGYGLTVVATFLVFCLVFKWQLFSSRYHLPFFVLFVPVAATVLGEVAPSKLVTILGVFFMILSWPWLFNLENRPLGKYIHEYLQNGAPPSEIESLDLGARLYQDYLPLTDPINHAKCNNVALMLSGNAAEYPFWRNLNAPRDDLEIEWIVAGTPSDKYSDPSFAPCAAVCQFCPEDSDSFHDLPLVLDYGHYKLFLREGE
jgi:hypothetical protein